VRAAAREPADRVVRGRDRWLAPSRESGSSRIPARRTTGTRSGRSPRSTRKRFRSGTRSASCPTSTRSSSRRLLVRRPPPLRRDRRASRRDGRGARVRRCRRLVLGHLQRLPDPLRGGPAAGRLLRNESLRFVCRDVPADGRAGRPALHRALHRRRAARAAGEARRRPLPPPPDLDPAQVVLRYVDNPNGSVGDIAGVCNEPGNVMGLMPHPRARGRSAARLGRRRAAPRLARRRRPRARARRLLEPE
jgi:hypothetical protein